LDGFSTAAKLLRTPYYLCRACVKVRENPARSPLNPSLSVRYVVRFVHEPFKAPSIECVSHVTEPHPRSATRGGEDDENKTSIRLDSWFSYDSNRFWDGKPLCWFRKQRRATDHNRRLQLCSS